MRIYDPRLGRFLSVDPITKEYPWLTPYQFASNRPIDGVDLDGKEWSASKSGNTVAFTVKIAVYNESSTLSNAKQLQRLVNRLEAKIENIFKKSFTNADGTTTNYTLDIQFDIKPTDPKEDAKFKLIFRDVEPKTYNEQTGEATFQGGATIRAMEGNNASQENTLNGTLKVKNPDGNDLVIEESSLIRNLAHELGHTGGLPHVFDEASPADINQKDIGYAIGATIAGALIGGASKKEIKSLSEQLTDYFTNILKSNLMNSEQNPSEELRTSNSSSTKVTRGQFQLLEQTVSSQQPAAKKEDEKK